MTTSTLRNGFSAPAHHHKVSNDFPRLIGLILFENRDCTMSTKGKRLGRGRLFEETPLTYIVQKFVALCTRQGGASGFGYSIESLAINVLYFVFDIRNYF